MNHADVRAKMADYLEGHLALGDRALLDAHLDACPDCADEIAEIRATIAAMRSLPEPEVPGDFAANVMRRIRAGDAEPGWLGRLSSILDELGSPRVLVPVSASILSVGLVLWGQQLGVLSTMNPHDGDRTTSQALAEMPPSVVTSGGAPSEAMFSGEARLAGASGGARGAAPLLPREARLGSPVPRDDAPPSFTFQIVMGDGHRSPYVLERNGGVDVVPIPWRTDQSAPPGVPGFGTIDGWSTGSVAVSSSGLDPSVSDGSMQPQPSGRAPEYGSPLAPPGREPRSRDEWLVILETNPADFAWRLSRLSLAERELWVDRLAQHARQQGALDRVVSRLQSAGGSDGELLAQEFADAGTSEGASSSSIHIRGAR